MTQPYYYEITNETPDNDAAWLSGLGAGLNQIATTVVSSGLPESVRFVIGTASSAGAGYAVDDITLDVEATANPNEIKIGDDLYDLDQWVDAAVGTALTAVVLTAFGITSPLSVIGITAAAATGVVYSKFIDPITDDILLTLNGQDEVKLIAANGDHYAGYIYPEGLDDVPLAIMRQMITDSNLSDFDFTGALFYPANDNEHLTLAKVA